MEKTNPFVQWWFTPKLPREHLKIDTKGLSPSESVRMYFVRILIHPVKRRVARCYLWFLKTFIGLKVVAITGSAGKTTTKDMVASILELMGKTVSTFENIDPIYNIPTTILRCSPSTRYLVLEMGVEYKGEMDFYLWLSRPDIGVITNIYPTHTEFFGSVEGVFREKSSLVKALGKSDTSVLFSENSYLKKLARDIKSQIVWFGSGGQVRAKNIEFTKDLKTKFDLQALGQSVSVTLPTVGVQFVQNALAACGVAVSFGIDIKKIKRGLEAYKQPRHRMKALEHKSGAIVLDDSYNNNPAAATNAIDTLVSVFKGRKRVVVMGDMLELGKLEKKEHERVGKYLSKAGIDVLIGVGNASKYMVNVAKKRVKETFWVENEDGVDEILDQFLKKDTIILIKGSRSIELDELVKRLT